MSDRLVIFDCDGVLVDSEALSSRVMAEALTELGYPVSADDCIRRFTGISMATLMERVEADWGRSLPPHFESDIQERDFAAFRAELAPVDGVEDALATMSHAKCVASSGAVEKMHLTLSITGLLPYFEPHLFSSSMVRRGKPAPDLFCSRRREWGIGRRIAGSWRTALPVLRRLSRLACTLSVSGAPFIPTSTPRNCSARPAPREYSHACRIFLVFLPMALAPDPIRRRWMQRQRSGEKNASFRRIYKTRR